MQPCLFLLIRNSLIWFFVKMSHVQPKNLRHILITGASSGLGAALACHYAQPNRVLGLHGRNEARLEQTAQICRKKGAQCVLLCGDVTHQNDLIACLQDFDSTYPVDLLLANAGIAGGSGQKLDLVHKNLPLSTQNFIPESLEQACRILEVNMMGVVYTVQALIPAMMERGYGQIGLVSSLAGWRGWPGAPAYCASKAGVKAYGESLRISLKSYGINVHVIMPGFIDTPLTRVNPFPMPFLMSDTRAAHIIAHHLKRGKGRIAFPWPMASLAWLCATLPASLMDKVLNKMPAKPAMSELKD